MANIQGFGIQLATGGFSLEANTIFATFAEALAYAQSAAAYVGKVISVTGGEQKGLYTIEAVGENASFKKVGSDIDTSNFVTKDEVSSVYKAKGSVATYDDLPTNAQPGDVYNVVSTGKNYVWVENLVDGNNGWDDLGGIVNLEPYALKADVEESIQLINQAFAETTNKVNAANAAIAGKVDKVENASLIPNDKLALIDTHTSAIGSLIGKDEDFELRLATIEGAFKGEGGEIDLGDITAQLGAQGGRILALESDNNTNKQSISDLQGSLGGHATRLTAIETLNTEQSTQLQGLTDRVVEVEKYGSAITNLTGVANKNTEDIGKINSAIEGLAIKSVAAGDKVLFADANGALSASLKLNYDSDNKKIQILGLGDQEVAFLDATAFIKDGMLDSATYDPDTKKITLAWNTESGKSTMDVDLTSLVDTYTAGSGLALSGNAFSVKVSADSKNRLTIAEDGLLVDISSDVAAINSSVDDKINRAFAWIDVTANQE